MGLLRTTVILGTIVALMPTDEHQQARLRQQAASAVHWASTFCERNAHSCQTMAGAWTTFQAKAQFAVRMAADTYWNHDKPAPSATPSVTAEPASERRRADGTLRPEDMLPAWRTPRPQRNL